jgi:hypothetical protein
MRRFPARQLFRLALKVENQPIDRSVVMENVGSRAMEAYADNEMYIDNSFAGLSTEALYRLLGVAWIAQLHPIGGDCHYLGSSLETGKREFAILAPLLRKDLSRPYRHGIIDCVANTIHRSHTWAMPADVVAALAVRTRMNSLQQSH